ncbi:methyltransferase domain-containing protein [Candidatus Woesearchaeota archaeon]|nr:methyltransferase domain-containing protein [Candidatus Woesearchaeota archaeon]
MHKLLIQREKKEYVKELDREVTITKRHEYFVSDIAKDFGTMHGTIKAKDLKAKDGSIVKSSQGTEFIVLSPTFPDMFKRIRKQAQTVMAKDLGLILAETGVGADSLAVDAGAGSGAMACFLARHVKKVVTYEIRDDFLENVKANIKLLGLTNVTLKHGDITKNVAEKNVDLFTLDLPEPWHTIPVVAKALKVGGWLAGYCPHVSQVMQLADAIRKDKRLQLIKCVELIQRDWVVDAQRSRPDNRGVGHTAFLVFARKFQS